MHPSSSLLPFGRRGSVPRCWCQDGEGGPDEDRGGEDAKKERHRHPQTRAKKQNLGKSETGRKDRQDRRRDVSAPKRRQRHREIEEDSGRRQQIHHHHHHLLLLLIIIIMQQTFIEPELRPPLHRYEITEPLRKCEEENRKEKEEEKEKEKEKEGKKKQTTILEKWQVSFDNQTTKKEKEDVKV